jgi:hypothetical protein
MTSRIPTGAQKTISIVMTMVLNELTTTQCDYLNDFDHFDCLCCCIGLKMIKICDYLEVNEYS